MSHTRASAASAHEDRFNKCLGERAATDSVVKAVVLKGADGFMLALFSASRYIQFDVYAVERAAAAQDDVVSLERPR